MSRRFPLADATVTTTCGSGSALRRIFLVRLRGARPVVRFRAFARRAPAGLRPHGMERWLSGRKHRTRNAAYVEAYRGFESHPLRHKLLETIRYFSPCVGASCADVADGARGAISRRSPPAAGGSPALRLDP